jgi:hypothetical protein
MKIFKAFSILFILLFFSCNNSSKIENELAHIYETIKKQYAPDKRVQLFDIHFKKSDNTVVLTGETTSRRAFSMLLDSLKKRNIDFNNKVRVLPDSAVGNKIYALGNNSVINIRSLPKHAAELGTQGLLGMKLRVIDRRGNWYRVQTPDNYISWVDAGGIVRITAEGLLAWNKKEKIIYTTNSGFVYEMKNENSTRVSDIVFGGILELKKEHASFYEVEYPDGRIGFVKKSEAVLYHFWLKNNPSSGVSIEESAKKMLGIPYLWGGTSTKGNDCSGFTKTVYLMNGFVIPRDASQQVHAGMVVDKELKFEGLEKGDLLFFGTPATKDKKQRVTHVGIWLGNNKGEFIHSKRNVHISSINESEKNYNEFDKNRYLGSRRYLGVKDDKIIELKKRLEMKP